MKIRKARELGFCHGVRRALKIIESAVADGQQISTLGPIVHNRTVVTRLRSLGVNVVSELPDFGGGVVAVSSHGVAPSILRKIKCGGAKVIDTTCPTVRSAQKAAARLAEDGFGIIIYGEGDHPEVRGLLGWAGEGAVAAMKADEIGIDTLPPRVGILAQTTQSSREFTGFVNRLVQRLLPTAREIRVVNTLCRETQKRQAAAVELAGASDLMIVVGGHNSANTARLAEVCSSIAETHHIESADEIKPEWLKGRHAVGVTAGASTPDESIAQVMERLRSA